MKKINRWLVNYWKPALGFSVGLAFVIMLYIFQINSLTGGFSKIERTYIASTSSFGQIFSETVFMPHKLLSLGANAISENSNYARFPSAIIMIFMIICFYVLMERWYTRRIALLSTLLFATSSWTLTIGRQALPTVLYFSWLPILALLYWTTSKSKNYLSIFLWVLSLTLAFYVPGLLWFVVVLAASQRQRLRRILVQTPRWQTVLCLLLFIILTIPFIYSAVQSPLLVLQSLGLPSKLSQITGFPSRLLDIFSQIFVYSSGNPVFHIGHLPYLDVSTILLFIIGLYRLRYSSARKMMNWSGLITIGWLIGVGSSAVNIAIFIPLIYVFAGSGISFLLVQWFRVFPKNPIARIFATSAMTIVVLLISFYHLSRYYIAWPLNPATKSVFSNTDGKIEE